MPPPLTRFQSIFLLTICVVVGITSIGGIWISAASGAWFVFAFEIVVAVASIFGALLGIGYFRDAPALAALCVGGCFLVGALLGEPTLTSVLVQGEGADAQLLAGINPRPWAIGRLLVGLIIIAMSGWIVLTRRPGASFPLLFRGILCGVPVVLALGALVVPSLQAKILALPNMALASIAIVAFFVLAPCFAVGVQYVIRAFAAGIPALGAAATPAKP